MSQKTTSGMLSRPLIQRARTMSCNPCSGSRVTSPYTLIATFLRRHVDAHVDARPFDREPMNGRAELSKLLEVEVTEDGYRLLIGPLLVADSAGGPRLSDDEIARHGRWWLDQLP